MTAHRVNTDLGLALAKAGILTVDSNNVVLLRNRSHGVFKPAAGTYKLPNVAAHQLGTIVYVCPTGSAVMQTAAAVTISTVPSGAAAAFQAVSTSSWVALGGSAESVALADAGLYTSATTVEAAIQELYSDSTRVELPLTGFVSVLGAQLTTWADNPASNPGFHMIGATGPLSIRWNDNGTQAGIQTQTGVPRSVTPANSNFVFHALLSKVGATVGDAVTLDVAAFPTAYGLLHDGTTSMGGTTSAINGALPSKTVSEVTLSLGTFTDAGLTLTTLAAISFQVKPTNGKLGADDLLMHRAWLTIQNL